MSRKKYTKEFKLETIKMYENCERTASEIEQELGITLGLLSRWKQRLDKVSKKEEVFPGNGKMMDTEACIRQLERENLQLRQDKDILKKCWECSPRTESEIPVYCEAPGQISDGTFVCTT